MMMTRYEINNRLCALAEECGVKLDDDTMNELTHHVADVLGVEMLDQGLMQLRFLGIGLLKGIKEAEPGMKVLKVGRTTGLTHGKINDIEVDQRYVSFGKGDARFDGIISVESAKKGQPFCDGGDSGSLIISEHGYAVGLLFAGTDFGGAFDQGLTYANRIQDVLKILKAELIMG